MKAWKYYFAVLLATFAVSVQAQTSSGWAQVKELHTGWSADRFTVVTDIPVINPANCPAAAQYDIDPDAPGLKLYYATLLTAYTNSLSVVMTVDDHTCTTNGWPKIIGVALVK